MDASVKQRNACDSCRKRKVKCSGHRPNCTHCARYGLPCEYSRARRLGRPRRSNTAKDSRCRAADHSLLASSSSPPPARRPPSPSPPQNSNNNTSDAACRPEPRPAMADLDDLGPAFSCPIAADDPVSLADPSADHAWLMPPSGPDMPNTQPFDASQWYVPCIVQHGPLADAFLQGEPNQATNFTRRTCQCSHSIAQYFTAEDRPSGTLERVLSLRRALDLADKVLQCAICFDVSRSDAPISKNILLLGALMSDIAMSYGHIIFYLKDAASFCVGGRSDSFDIVFGLQAQADAVLNTTLDGDTYWFIIRGAVMQDLQRLFSICIAFEKRQLKAHELGHEACESGHVCRYRQQEKSSAISKYIDTCPRSIGDPKRVFSCFRTVNQVFAAIRETRNMLAKLSHTA